MHRQLDAYDLITASQHASFGHKQKLLFVQNSFIILDYRYTYGERERERERALGGMIIAIT
jgi:hypothetical protein